VADRFFCPSPAVNGRVWLEGDEAHHLARVCRLGPGTLVEVFDGRGGSVAAEVLNVGRAQVELLIKGDLVHDPPAACALTLATAAPKAQRLDWLVEKATELGVERLVLLTTERSVVEPRAGKVERLRRLVIEASKQCGRSRLMEIETPQPVFTYLAAETASVRVLAQPAGLPPAAWPQIDVGARVALAIGPEGGFTEGECAAARAAGWQAIGLGPTILRVETAALAACAALMLRAVGQT
jgi:16S rRNA (uracil1498-N3)-methyltransferase